MQKKVNLLDKFSAESIDQPIDVIRTGPNEIGIIPFTADGEEINLHFCPEAEINSYVVCNEESCLLCKIGRKKELRLLLPCYIPAAGSIGVLPISPSCRPRSLMPQIANVLKAEKPMAVFVSREGAKYTVSTYELPKDVDSGEIEIKQFLKDYEAGNINLSSIYQKIENEMLAGIEEIHRIMQLKGIDNAADKRP